MDAPGRRRASAVVSWSLCMALSGVLGATADQAGAAAATAAAGATAPAAAAPAAAAPAPAAGRAPATTPSGSTDYPPLGTLVIPTPLPGFAPAPPGALNGPITSTTFPAFSSDPAATAHTQATLAAVPDYAGYIRTWNDREATGGQNDVVVYLFRIPDAGAATAFVAQIEAWYHQEPQSHPYPIASIPGASGFALSVSSPQPATEQVVIFRSGVYVAWIELASVSGPTNPNPLGPAQAEPVAYSQYVSLYGAVGGSSPAPPGATAPTPAPATTGGGHGNSNGNTGSGGGDGVLVGAVVAVVILAAAVMAVMAVVRHRRRQDALPALGTSTADPLATALAGMGSVEAAGQRAGTPSGVPCLVPSLDDALDRDPDEAGWYRDPSGDPDSVRYWDGRTWTRHVAVRTPVA